jgi:GT2 family glycosyltransferase
VDLSVVVASWNTRELTLACLASVDLERERLRGEAEIELCLVDNGSSDATAEAVRSAFPWVRVIALPRNLGFSAACNRGLTETSGRYRLLLNSDAALQPGCIEIALAYLDRYPEVGALGPRLVGPGGELQNSAHAYPSALSELVPLVLLQLARPRRYPSRRWHPRAAVDVDAVRGAALFLSERALRRIGPLSEEYFFFLEETDWCWRARVAGFRVVYLPEVSVMHVSGASSKRKHPARTRIEYHRSLYRFLLKYRGLTPAAAVFALRVAKLVLYSLGVALPAAISRAYRARLAEHLEVLAWHLRGCPQAVGLRALGAPSAPESASREASALRARSRADSVGDAATRF